jgi:nucleotide-binding universal stress UspA family protein
MFEHALIAVDVRSQVPLVNCVPDLKHWGVSSLTLLNVVRLSYGEGPLPGQIDDHEEALEELADGLRSDGFQVDMKVERTNGDVASQIVETASETDLLVMGTRSRSLVLELFLGSVVRDVVDRATVPILLEWVDVNSEVGGTRATLACTDSLRRVLLATDLMEGSTAAHEAAVALAARGATIDCAHVVETDEFDRFPEWKTMFSAVLQGLIGRFEAAGANGGEAIIDKGEPVPRLLEIAAERDASLIVVGESSRKWPETLVGSTARQLCEHAGVPVLLVHRPRHSA